MNEVKDIIYKCYSECPRSVELYHDYAGFDLNQVIDNFLEKMNGFKDLEFKTVEHNGDLVGYFGIVNDFDLPMLWTFFTRPKYRKTDLLWNEIEKKFGGVFAAGVFSSNLPARKYLLRHGGKEIIKGNGSYFIFERE